MFKNYLSINIIFIAALTGGVSGVLLSTAAAWLSMPVTAWFFMYVGLAGFFILFVLVILMLAGEVSRRVCDLLCS